KPGATWPAGNAAAPGARARGPRVLIQRLIRARSRSVGHAPSPKTIEHFVERVARLTIQPSALCRRQVLRLPVEGVYGRRVVGRVRQVVIADALRPAPAADYVRGQQVIVQQRVRIPWEAIFALRAVQEMNARVGVIAQTKAGELKVEIALLAPVIGHRRAEA